MSILATTSLVFIFHFAILANCEDAFPMKENDENFHLLLGKSIYVPNEDLLGSIPNGITFFKDIPFETCKRKIEQAITTKDQSFYKNTEELYKSIATQSNLKATYESAFTLGVTVDVTTKHVSGKKREVSGTSLNLATKKYEIQLSPNCLYETNLQQRLINDFNNLDIKVRSPWQKSSWRDYHSFLTTHGSHVITGVTYGSSVDQYAFAEQSEEYSSRDFTVKACVSLGGVKAGPGKLGLSACSGVTQEEKEKLTNKKMTSTITVKGGTPNTRSKLIYQRSDDLIIQFLEEGNTNPTPIKFELTPIWQILRRQVNTASKDSGTHVRATTLEYYFDGYLNFGCPYKKGRKGPVLQKFDLAPRSLPTDPVYECTLAAQGCHSDSDCHYHVGVWCNCAGESCIRHTQKSSSCGSSNKLTAEPYRQSDWGWQGCDWKVWGSVCMCNNEFKERVRVF